MVLAVFGIALGFAGYRLAVYLRTSAALAVRCIEIQGTARTDADEIKRFAGLSEGQNIFSIDLQKAKRKLQEHPWIRKATVQRVVPDRLVVEVQEQQPAALIALDRLYLVNTKGEIFKRVQPGEQLNMVVITGITREKFRDEPERASEQLRESLDVMGLVKNTTCLSDRHLAELHRDDLFGTSLVLDPGALVVRLGRDISEQRMRTLCLLLGELKYRSIRVDEIMMDDPTHRNRAVVRLAGVATALSMDSNGNKHI